MISRYQWVEIVRVLPLAGTGLSSRNTRARQPLLPVPSAPLWWQQFRSFPSRFTKPVYQPEQQPMTGEEVNQ